MKLLTALACAFLAIVQLKAQPISNIRVTLPRQLPANTGEWAGLTPPILISAQAKPVQGRIPPEVMESRVVVTIEKSGAKICGAYAPSNAPMSSFTSPVKTWTGAQAVGLLGQDCTLPPGDYELCVVFWGSANASIPPKEISEKKCTPFSIVGNTEYGSPTLISPENDKKYKEEELQRPVTFRWTPLVPKPREAVTYRLKVWQLMQGQNATTAMRTNQPMVTKDVDNITQTVVNAVITGPCRPPYLCDFVWNVQALDRTGKPIGNNNGTSENFLFGIQDAGSAKPPSLLAPANKTNISPNDAKTIKFRWTPLVPRPQEPVTYRLKVWQLMQGQNAATAMRTNKPIVTKDVADITEATVTGIYTGPCRPPYLCDFIWEVQALNRNGQPIGSNEGKSETFAFAISQYIIQLDSIKVNCTNTPGVYSFSYTITNPNPGTAQLNAFVVTSSAPAGASIGSFAPPLNTNIASGAQLTITGTINAAPNLSNICIGAEIKDQVNSFWKASKDTCINVVPCKCDACDEKNFTLNVPVPQQISFSNNNINYNQPVTITSTKTIKTVTADLVYFEMVPENDFCIPCNKDDVTYGHFTNGTNTQSWNVPPALPATLPFSITTPQLTPCCKAKFRWCVRYKIEFTDCTSCNKLVCYEKEKAGCDYPNANNPK